LWLAIVTHLKVKLHDTLTSASALNEENVGWTCQSACDKEHKNHNTAVRNLRQLPCALIYHKPIISFTAANLQNKPGIL
jgi:hypothetical protein